MTVEAMSSLPLQAGGAVAAAAGRTALWAISLYMRQPLRNTAVAMVATVGAGVAWRFGFSGGSDTVSTTVATGGGLAAETRALIFNDKDTSRGARNSRMVPMYASAYSTTNRPLTGGGPAVLDCPMNPNTCVKRKFDASFTPPFTIPIPMCDFWP